MDPELAIYLTLGKLLTIRWTGPNHSHTCPQNKNWTLFRAITLAPTSSTLTISWVTGPPKRNLRSRSTSSLVRQNPMRRCSPMSSHRKRSLKTMTKSKTTLHSNETEDSQMVREVADTWAVFQIESMSSVVTLDHRASERGKANLWLILASASSSLMTQSVNTIASLPYVSALKKWNKKL